MDLAAAKDKNSEYKSQDGLYGYGNYSEGINLNNGFDLNTLKVSNSTFLQIMNNRLTGTKVDEGSEASEFLVKGDARYSNFTWTSGVPCGTGIMSYYQPQIVEIAKQDENGKNVEGATLQLYYGEELLDEWKTEGEAEKKFLMTGEYTLKEKETPTGYKTADEIAFWVDIKDKLLQDGNQVEKIVMKDERKETKVVVHHCIINSDGTKTTTKVPSNEEGKVIEDEEIDGKVFDEYETAVATNILEYYELVQSEIPENSKGTMTEEQIVVTYYYRLKQSPYTVNYYDKDTNEKIKTTKNGSNKDYGTEVTVESEKIDIEKYDYTSSNVAGDANKDKLTIGLTEADNVINLYYTKKKGNVVVKYVDKNTGLELEPNGTSIKEEKQAKVDETYTTEKKTIEGYVYVEDTGNTTGTYTLESVTTPIEVIYYYKQNTKVTTKHIDKISGEEIPEADGSSSQGIKEGLVGDSYTTESKNFENYVLVEEEIPSNKEGTMTSDEITVIYYYKHVAEGVIEKHVDDITGEVLYNKEHTGNEGDRYNIPSKTFTGYELVTDKLPTNSIGTMTKDAITVTYYYRYSTKVVTKYINKLTGEEIQNPDGTPTKEEKNGYAGEHYTTEAKEIEEYDLIEEELPENSEGTMTKDPIEVIYYYIQKSAGVTENHYDIKTGEKLKEEEKYSGHVDDNYETESKVFDEYEFVKVEKDGEVQENAETLKGKMTVEEIKINYYYIKKTNVITKYIDKLTGEEIEDQVEIKGVEDEEYKTEPKEIPGYDVILEEIPVNHEGTMTRENIEVIYYYQKKAEVEVKYVEEGTEEEIAPKEQLKGYVGDEYKTEKKDINYYNFVKSTENTEGKMGDEKIEVKYYYKKKIFNLKIEKQIKSLIINGQENQVNKDIAKKEIKKEEIENTALKVKYLIKVTNNGELTGKASIKENIPEGLEMLVDENKGWLISDKIATIETGELAPGESKEYEVTLTWKNTSENFGIKQNIAELINLKNEAGFEEETKKDNEDVADLILSVSTGIVNTKNGIIAVVVVLIALGTTMRKRQIEQQRRARRKAMKTR